MGEISVFVRGECDRTGAMFRTVAFRWEVSLVAQARQKTHDFGVWWECPACLSEKRAIAQYTGSVPDELETPTGETIEIERQNGDGGGPTELST